MTPARVSEQLAAEGLEAFGWSNAPGDRYAAHAHGYDKVIVAASGSIVFQLPDLCRDIALTTGDRLELPAETRHAAVVGPDGVACLEAHLPAGRLGGEPRHEPGWAQTDRAGTA